jgi:hypothetical protein
MALSSACQGSLLRNLPGSVSRGPVWLGGTHSWSQKMGQWQQSLPAAAEALLGAAHRSVSTVIWS